MNDPKSTNDIRMIAQDVTRQQAEVCAAKRESMGEKLTALVSTVSANATAISNLTTNVATVVTTVSHLANGVSDNEKDIHTLQDAVTRLKGRPAMWAAIGAAAPVAAGLIFGLILWWISK